MLADQTFAPAGTSAGRATGVDRASTMVGIVVVRGGGAPLAQRRLPRRAPASVGRRDRHAFDLEAEWMPKDLVVFEPVADGWIATNAGRLAMRVESDWLRSGEATFAPGAMVMLQRGDHRLGWAGLGGDLSISVNVRTRRMDDHRIPYAVDSSIDPAARTVGTYLGVPEAAISASLRYKVAVLFRHLIEGRPEPSYLVRTRAAFLGVPPEDLEWAAHRLRRRLNSVRGTDLQSLEELGAYLVCETGEIGAADLDP